jgi:hypothetical protein
VPSEPQEPATTTTTARPTLATTSMDLPLPKDPGEDVPITAPQTLGSGGQPDNENSHKKDHPSLENKDVVAIKNTKNSSPPTPLNATDVGLWPPATRLNYRLHGHYRGDLNGKAHVQWQRNGPRYQVQVDVGVGFLFNLRLTSQGRITPQALWPEVYEEERRGKSRGATLGDAVVQLHNGQTHTRPPQLQDTASQFVQLAQDFALQRRPLRVGAVVPVTLVRPGGIDEWVYDVVALDTLHTPLGEIAAFHLQPRPLAKARSGVDVDMWFAPALQHLPVRIRLNLGPEVWLDLLLEGIDHATPPQSGAVS